MLLKCVHIIAGILLLNAACAFAAESMTEADRLQFADGLYGRDLYELALAEYTSFLRDFTNSPRADAVHYLMGECLSGLGRNAEAEKEFETVFTAYPESSLRLKAGYRRATLAAAAGRNDEAVAQFNTLLGVNPPYELAAAILFSLGETEQKLGRTAEAAAAFAKVKTDHPKAQHFSYAVMKLAEMHAPDKARQDEVLELYRLAIQNPASGRIAAEALYQTAEIHFARKAYDKSAEAFLRLIKEHPEDSRAVEGRLQAAWACHNAGLYVDSLGVIAAATKSDTGDKAAEWLYLKANCERQLLKHEDAVATYGVLLEKHGGSPFADAACYERALTYYRMGKHKECIIDAEKALQKPDLKKDACWLLAESHSALKADDSAVQYYRMITTEFPKSDVAPDATYRLAHHLQTKKEYKEATRYFGLVAANYPENRLASRALFAAASSSVTDNRQEDALRDLATLVQKYAGDTLVEEALYQKAMCEVRLSRLTDAGITLRQLIEKFPMSKFLPDAHYWLGMMLSDEKKTRDAEVELDLAVKSGKGRDWEYDAKFRLAIAMQKNGKNDESAALLQGLLATSLKDGFSPALLEWLAEFRFSKKEYKESAEAARLIVQRSQEPAWQQIGWCLVGRSLHVMDDKAGAEEAYRKAFEIDVRTHLAPESALRLGEIILTGTNRADAVKFFTKAADLSSDEKLLGVRARAYVGLGRTAKAASDFEAAARYFMSVAVLFDDADVVPECLYEASQAYGQLGKKDAAAKAVAELKQRYPQSEWAKK